MKKKKMFNWIFIINLNFFVHYVCLVVLVFFYYHVSINTEKYTYLVIFILFKIDFVKNKLVRVTRLKR